PRVLISSFASDSTAKSSVTAINFVPARIRSTHSVGDRYGRSELCNFQITAGISTGTFFKPLQPLAQLHHFADTDSCGWAQHSTFRIFVYRAQTPGDRLLPLV